MPAVTVLIPVLNAMPYLSEALASLEAQTFRDFGVLFWDNGSSDGSVEEARRWIPGRLPGRVVADRPMPFHHCLATMVEESSTEFVARMDGDDICRAGRFQMQVEALRANLSVGIVGGQCPMMNSSGESIGMSLSGPLEHDDILTEMMYRSALTHPALMFRRESILKAGNYVRPKPVEDLDLYMRMAAVCEFRNLSSQVLDYRVHDKSISRTHAEQQQKGMIDVVADYSRKNYGISAEVYRRLQGKGARCSIISLLRSAAYRAEGNRRRFWRIVRSPSFIFIGRCMTAPRDYASRGVFGCLAAMSGNQCRTRVTNQSGRR